MTMQSKRTIIATWLIVLSGTLGFSNLATAFETPGSILEFNATLDVGGDATWTKTGSSAFETLTFVGGATPTATQVSDGTLNLFAHSIGADGVSNTYEQNLGGTVQASQRSATFEAWFKPNNLSTPNQIILETGGTGTGTIISLSNANLEFFANGAANTSISTTLTNTNWHQVVGVIRNTFDSTANDFLELYLDGVFLGDTSGSLININDWAGGNQGGFGSFGGTVHPSGSQVNGGLDTGGVDINGNLHLYRYYGRNLTGSEILANYNAVVNPATPWTMDASGNWNTAANWQSNPNVPGVGPLSGRDAILGTVATAPRTVTLNTNVNLSGLAFQNSNQYTVAAGGGTMTLSGSAELRATSGTHAIEAPIAGSAGILKTGSGTLTLSGTNSFTGTVGLVGGILGVSADTALGNAANGIEFNGGVLRIEGTTFGTLSRSVTMTGSGTINVDDPTHSVNVAGSVTGTGNLVKAGAGSARLSNASTFNGLLSVNGGTLVVNGSGGLGTTTGVTQIGSTGGTVELDGSGGSLTISENFQRLLARFTAVPEAHIRNTAGNNTINGTIEAGGGAFGNARFENSASGTTLDINNKVFYTDENTAFNFVFEGTGNFRVGNVATPNSGKIVGNDVNVVVNLDDPTDKVTIATAIASTDTSNATGSYWGGNTTIQSGTLEVLDGTLVGNDGELVSRRIDVQSGATFNISAFSIYNSQVTDVGPDLTAFTGDDVGQIFSGGGTINTGAGVLTIFEDSRVAPGDSAGTLNVTGNVRFNMTQANTNGGLDFELGSNTLQGGPNNDLLAVSGSLDLDVSGTGQYNLKVTPVAGNLAAGTYTIMTGTTAGSTATGANFAVTLVNSQGTVLNSRQTPTVSVNATNVQVTFTGAQSHNWTGVTNGTWDVATTANWSSSDNRFRDLDTVSFGNGTPQTTVNIAAPVTPGGMNFNNTVDTFTFTGNAIQGSGAMNLAANSKVILANSPNGFTGGISIAAGATLTLGDGSSNLGQLTSGSSVFNNGTLIYNRGGYSFNDQVISGSGALRVTAGYTDLSGANSYSGGSTVNGGTLRIRNPSAAGTGSITVNNGAALETGYFNNQSFSKSVTLNNGSTLSVTNPADSNVAAANSGQITWTSPITLGGTGGRVDTTAGDGIVPGMTVAGGITGTGNLTLSAQAARLLVVDSALTHSGNTAIAGGGTVALQNSTSINSPVIDLEENSTLDVTATTSGALALSGQSLRGVGTVAGNVTTAGSSLIRVGGVAGGLPITTTGLQLHYDAARDSSGNNTWVDLASTGGATNLVFTDGAASTVAASDATLQSLTAAYNVGTSGPALASASDFGYFDTRAQSSGTFEVVFRVTNTAAGNEQVLVDIGGTTGMALTLDGGALKAGVNGDAATTTGFTTPVTVGWHHAVVVITDTDPADGLNDGFALYLDNALVNSSSTVDIDDYAGSNQWGFGGRADSGAVVLDPTNGSNASLTTPIDYHGQLALMRYYQSALTPSEINQNYLSLSNPTAFVGVDTFSIDGNLTLNGASTLEIDIFNTTIGNDLLTISGNLAAAGTLDINLAGSVSLGDSFNVLDFAGASGGFSTINLPSLGGGLSWNTSALLTTGILSVVAGTPGDFDNDGDVDGRDFLLWQRGGSPSPFSGSDLATWQTAYNGGLLVANSTSVPEPTSLALLLAVGLVLTQCRQRI